MRPRVLSVAGQAGASLIAVMIAAGILGVVVIAAAVGFRSILFTGRSVQMSEAAGQFSSVFEGAVWARARLLANTGSCGGASGFWTGSAFAVGNHANASVIQTPPTTSTLGTVPTDEYGAAQRCASPYWGTAAAPTWQFCLNLAPVGTLSQDDFFAAEPSRFRPTNALGQMVGPLRALVDPQVFASSNPNPFAAVIVSLRNLNDQTQPITCSAFASQQRGIGVIYYAFYWSKLVTGTYLHKHYYGAFYGTP